MRCRKIGATSTNAENRVAQINILQDHFTHISLYETAPEDECARAAAIYDCGKKNAPELTNAIQNDLRNSASATPVGVLSRHLYSPYFSLNVFWSNR